MSRSRIKGLSLIELMVTLTILGIMVMLAVPGIGNWIGNSRVRTVGEEIQNGLRLAQAEAVSRNRQVAFVRTNAAPARNAAPSVNGTNWYIQVLPLTTDEGADIAFQSTAFVQGGAFSTRSGATVGGDALLCFNSVGRVVSNTDTGLGADCAAPTDALTPKALNVALTGSANRRLRAEIFLGGRVRMCDPDAATGQPQVCT
jgi:type IV fimbrial biogenesis protein FimT